MSESVDAFVENPLTGVGAGQFKNWNPKDREEAWHEAHNVWLQVAAELGIFGLAAFLFLVVRAFYSVFQTRRLLHRLRAAPGRKRGMRESPSPPDPAGALTPADMQLLDSHSAAMAASLAGWFVCAFFASVAYNWTFYYLLALAAAPHEILRDRVPALTWRQRPMRRRRVLAPPPSRRRQGGRMIGALLAAPVDAVRRLDRAVGQRSGRRRILVDARTPVNYTMVAPIHRAMAADPRVSFYFTASEEPDRLRDIYREAPGVAAGRAGGGAAPARSTPTSRRTSCGSRCRAARAASRCSTASAASTASTRRPTSMRAWDRLFFVNERRLSNFVAAGAIDAGSPAIRLVG